jgi:hypothetical protein
MNAFQASTALRILIWKKELEEATDRNWLHGACETDTSSSTVGLFMIHYVGSYLCTILIQAVM